MLNLDIGTIFGLEDILTFKKGGGIHIKKKNRGKFTKSAKAAGESVQEHAAHVLADPNATPLQKRRANFARNAAKWKHQNGGVLKMQFSGKFKTRDINGNWVYMDMNTGRTTSAGPESGTIRNNAVNSVGGDNKTKQGRTKIAQKQATSYNNKQYKVHNYADTTMRLKQKNQDVVLDEQGEPEIIQADYTPTLEAPMEIVSPEFDLLTLGRQAATSMYKAVKPTAKPTVESFADAAPTTLKQPTTLSQEQVEQAFNQAKQWHLNRINSPGYRDRALRAGFTEEEIPELQKQLTGQINRLKLQKPEDVLGSNIKLNNNSGEGALNASYWKVPTKDGRLVQGISFHNPNMSYDDAVSSFVHEFGHGATFGLNGTEEVGYKKMLADQFPLINRAVKYNKTLYPEVTEETVGKVFPYAAKVNKTAYFAEPTEIQSRGYEFMRDYGMNWYKAMKDGKLPTTSFGDLVGKRFNSRLFHGLVGGDKNAFNFMRNALSITAPVGMTAGYGMSSNTEDESKYLGI